MNKHRDTIKSGYPPTSSEIHPNFRLIRLAKTGPSYDVYSLVELPGGGEHRLGVTGALEADLQTAALLVLQGDDGVYVLQGQQVKAIQQVIINWK